MTEQTPSPGAATTMISLTEIYTLSFAAALARGFPDPACDEIALRVLWLESRGLPGLIALTREFLNNHDTDPRERGMQCPLIAGATLQDRFDELISKDPGRPNVIEGPSNGVLLLPKVAQYAEKIGEPIRVSWLMSDPPGIKAQTVVDGDSAASFGEPEALLFNTGVGFALHGEEMMEGGQGPDINITEIPKQVFEPLIGFIGRERAEIAIKVHSILSGDTETLNLLRMMSDGDRSIIASPAGLEPDKKIAFMTAPGSNNDLLWGALGRYGWTVPSNDDVPEELMGVTAKHVLTDAGRAAMPLLVYALDQFPATAH